MHLDNLRDAATFVREEFFRRNYEIQEATFVNNFRNMVFEVINPVKFPERFFLKYDRNPYFGIGYEVDFPYGEKKGICINKGMVLDYVDPRQADILYALTDMVYHVPFIDFDRFALEHVQKYNQEQVYALPFSKLKEWARP